MSYANDTDEGSSADSAQVGPTPGPWHVPGQPWYDDNRSAVFSEADPNAGKLICANQHAEFNPEQYEDGEVEANTRLIAAAPRLLSELEKVYGLLVRLNATHDHLVRRKLIHNVEEVLAAAWKEETSVAAESCAELEERIDFLEKRLAGVYRCLDSIHVEADRMSVRQDALQGKAEIERAGVCPPTEPDDPGEGDPLRGGRKA